MHETRIVEIHRLDNRGFTLNHERSLPSDAVQLLSKDGKYSHARKNDGS